MALHALQVEERLHLGRPERRWIGPTGMVYTCQYKQYEQGKVASLVHRQTSEAGAGDVASVETFYGIRKA
jgi:hypothetical protein